MVIIGTLEQQMKGRRRKMKVKKCSVLNWQRNTGPSERIAPEMLSSLGMCKKGWML